MIHSCSFSPGIKFLSLKVVSKCPSFFQLLLYHFRSPYHSTSVWLSFCHSFFIHFVCFRIMLSASNVNIVCFVVMSLSLTLEKVSSLLFFDR